MNYRWQLKSLYENFDDSNLIIDLSALDGLPEKYALMVSNLEALSDDDQDIISGLEGFLTHFIEDSKLLKRLEAFGHLTFKADASSQEGLRLLDKVQMTSSALTGPLVRLKYWLPTGEHLQELSSQSNLIKAHLFYLTEQKESTRHMLSPKEEAMISRLKSTGSAAFETLQSKTASQLMGEVEIEGQQQVLPIMAIRNLAFSANPGLRKKGYNAELSAYKKHEEISASALNSIKGEVITLSTLRGFESPLDETLYNARLSKETLDTMIETMEEYLPHFRRYLKIKAKKLGYEPPYKIAFYDIAAPIGDKTPTYTIEEAKAFVISNFADFSKDLSDFAQKCFDLAWVDFEPRAGKAGGAFCANIHGLGESRVLLNFTGSFKNVLTIAHELGHAYHGDRLKSESILNTNYPMPLAETASIFCETIVRNAALKSADETLKLTILENRLQGAMQVIMDILSRYYFETQVFEHRKDHPLSVEELKKLMCESQLKAYGDSLDPEHLHPYMWLNKPHYYYASRNFYNFPYAFGLLFATGLYAQYLERGQTFLSEYDALLKATGKMSIESVCMLANINPKSKDFWKSSLELIKKDIDGFENLIENSLQ